MTSRLVVPFFLSGIAALIYQVAWQRLLFAAFGVDIESVTLIVSIFMCGLGLGGLAGGQVADKYPNHIPLAFCLTELAIALLGMVSVAAISYAGVIGSALSLPGVAALTFALLLPPTMLMGSTLPMLVAHAARAKSGVGQATGTLYFVNTLGAAVGAFATGFVLLYWIDLQQATWVAAAANLTSALWVAVALSRGKHG